MERTTLFCVSHCNLGSHTIVLFCVLGDPNYNHNLILCPKRKYNKIVYYKETTRLHLPGYLYRPNQTGRIFMYNHIMKCF